LREQYRHAGLMSVPCGNTRYARGVRPGGGDVEITGIISALLIGLIIGAMGRLVIPGRQPLPLWLTALIGVAAALLGTVIATGLGVAVTPGLDWAELFIQVALAALGVPAVVAVRHRSRTRAGRFQ
jgi:uncharacterized membrane protein YeaQ/YmgE (transglycosylase-associated protein family)